MNDELIIVPRTEQELLDTLSDLSKTHTSRMFDLFPNKTKEEIIEMGKNAGKRILKAMKTDI